MADSQRIEDLRRRVQRDPTSIAFAQLAEECRRAGYYQESVDVCRAGLEIHPGYLSARVTLGRSLIELNDLDVALAELEHVLKSAPDNLAAIRGVAEIRHRQGDLSEALTQYRAALALARNDPDLQRTVDELARKVEPVTPAAADEGLSFEQMQNELLQNLPPPPPVKPAEPLRTATAAARETPAAPPMEPEKGSAEEAASIERMDVVASDQSSERARAVQMIAALEQWVDAIHVARAQSRT
jgi:tetratricopeptide (TPR) repeat protein